VKHTQIVEAAIKRFSHFGIHKTTLAEIAEDLSISKQALAYYFADKQSIVAAVEKKILDDYKNELSKALADVSSVKGALLSLIRLKRVYFEKYFMLAAESDNTEFFANKSAGDWKQTLKVEEIKLLKPVLENGVRSGEIMPLDIPKTSELLLDTLYAFRRCMKDKGIPDASSFYAVFAKQLEVTELFYNGLKTAKWKS
jgi:TetR/AcrR family transcriptional repressor of mexJK operon